jgi:hypothetical protein
MWQNLPPDCADWERPIEAHGPSSSGRRHHVDMLSEAWSADSARTECAAYVVGHRGRQGPESSMPYPLIPTALGVCFLLVWVLIAGMIVRDGRQAARRESNWDENVLPLAHHRGSAPHFARSKRRLRRKPNVRAAS